MSRKGKNRTYNKVIITNYYVDEKKAQIEINNAQVKKLKTIIFTLLIIILYLLSKQYDFFSFIQDNWDFIEPRSAIIEYGLIILNFLMVVLSDRKFK